MLAEPLDQIEQDAVDIGGERARVLVVDDSEAIRTLFQVMLSMALPDVEIDTADNGQAAVEAFVRNRHSVLLLDLNMPVMDGPAAFRRIAEMCALHDWEMPRVVFCTGYAPPPMVRDIVDKPSRHRLLCKPVTEESLVQTVRSCLAR